MREPPFWWRARGIEARLLAPAAAIYGAVAARRLARRGARAGVPVVCIGNPTVGGAGKTPTALAVARMFKAAGECPVLLSRGYGGRLAGPVEVDPAHHRAADVGDEPLLLARAAPAIVARDRAAGAAAALAAGASVIVMDDGFQNPSLAKDFSVLVVDGRRGVGNASVIPAGPLRAPLSEQLECADAVVVVGPIVGAAAVIEAARERGLRVFRARLEPEAGAIAELRGVRVLAFAGVGDPAKVFATLADAGVTLAATRSFPDHHRYTPGDMQSLCAQADAEGLVLVTTEKDLARLHGEPAMARFAERVLALPVTLVFEDEAAFKALLFERIAAARSALPR
jgi:tetraacyldisaccharide 4'-kinase